MGSRSARADAHGPRLEASRGAHPFDGVAAPAVELGAILEADELDVLPQLERLSEQARLVARQLALRARVAAHRRRSELAVDWRLRRPGTGRDARQRGCRGAGRVRAGGAHVVRVVLYALPAARAAAHLAAALVPVPQRARWQHVALAVDLLLVVVALAALVALRHGRGGAAAARGRLRELALRQLRVGARLGLAVLGPRSLPGCRSDGALGVHGEDVLHDDLGQGRVLVPGRALVLLDVVAKPARAPRRMPGRFVADGVSHVLAPAVKLQRLAGAVVRGAIERRHARQVDRRDVFLGRRRRVGVDVVDLAIGGGDLLLGGGRRERRGRSGVARAERVGGGVRGRRHRGRRWWCCGSVSVGLNG